MHLIFIHASRDNSAKKIRAVTTVIILYFLSPNFLWGQYETKSISAYGIEMSAKTVNPEINAEFCSGGKLPEFPGGMEELATYAKENLSYPESARTKDIQGTVLLEFTVDTTGKIIDEKVKISVSKDLDNECLSMLQKMPVWEPGTVNGKAIAVQYLWPIKFTLKKPMVNEYWEMTE